MNRLSDQFLAGAGLAADQNRGLGRSNFADEFEDFTHRRMLANETARSIRVACLGAHPQLLDLAAQAAHLDRARRSRSTSSGSKGFVM
jgi:hypothetical protein